VRQPELALAIVFLIALEANHLKWIWWEYWDCRRCGLRNKRCSCGRSKTWMLWL
jgi:hypothetical protein